MIGSDKVFRKEYFIGSEDGYFHSFPPEDDHVSYKGEKVYDNLDDLLNSESGRSASACPECLKSVIADVR